MTDRLFVYGTLAPGRANEHILQSVPGTWEPAVVKGRLSPPVLSEEADSARIGLMMAGVWEG